MLLRKNPRTVLKIGFVFMALASLSRWFLKPGPRLSESWSDALMGFLYGIAIATMLLGVWMLGRQKRAS